MQTAGANTVLWDGRDKSGLQVPQGRYLISIIGCTDTGQEVRTIVPLQKVSRP
jgi:flagellar hook assembly protein FlgD